MRQFSTETEFFIMFSRCRHVREIVSPSESPNHASSHLLPNTSLIPKTSNRCSNSVNNPNSLSVISVQSPTHTSVSPIQSPSHTPSIASPVIPSTCAFPVKLSTHAHSSVPPVCKNTSSTCKAPLSTASALSTRHVNIREATDKEYHKNFERMKTQYAKRKRHQFNSYCAGHSVMVRLSKNEQSLTDMPCLLRYITEVRRDLYQLKYKLLVNVVNVYV